MIASAAAPAMAGAPTTSLRPLAKGGRPPLPGFDRIIANAKLGGTVSFAVADAQTGKVLETHNAGKPIPPASVTKSVTALYALAALGPEHRFVTRLMAKGGVSGGVVRGDLILAGGGDPMLDTNHLASLAAKLKQAGIREVKGRFLVYDGALPRVDRIDTGQPDHVGYNPAVSGLALNFNRVHFEWRRSSGTYSVTMDARTTKYRPNVGIARMKVVNRDLPVYTYKSANRRDEWTVASRALGNGGARWLPVRQPGLYVGDVFRTMARSQGIVLPAATLSSAAPTGTELARHTSPPLRDILRDMLKFSNNLIAEMVGLAATRAKGSKPASLKASASAMSRWASQTLGMSGTKLVDHSGLGDASRMTATDMTRALTRVRAQGFRGLLKPIAVRDAKGRVQKGHPIKIHAKTGTLNFVSALSGYMTAADGTELVFAIFAADTQTRARIKKANREAPQGARSWNGRAKAMQQALIARWGRIVSG